MVAQQNYTNDEATFRIFADLGTLSGSSSRRGRSAAEVAKLTVLETPLGGMAAAATDDHLVLLHFLDHHKVNKQIDRMKNASALSFVEGHNSILEQTRRELDEYFAGARQIFDVPMMTHGTPFQRVVWTQLQTIPFAETRSYGQQALDIERPRAVRAVARANGQNRISILIPCHRVIGADGSLTGYGGQLWRKKALLELETRTLKARAC